MKSTTTESPGTLNMGVTTGQTENGVAPLETADETFERLPRLAPGKYDRACGAEATRMGIQVDTPDREVAGHHLKSTPQSTALVPWPDPVDGAALLDEIREVYLRFIVLPPNTADTLAVYTLNTYVAAECFHYCAIVLVVSPEHECGKGRVHDVAQQLCLNAFRTANTSAPVQYHLVSDSGGHGTLLLDEMDSQAREHRERIANVLKSGFEKTGKSHRLEKEGNKMKLVEFSTYCPKICAAISLNCFGRATVSRSIVVRMRKRRREEKVAKFRRYDGTEIRRKCLRWAMDNAEKLRNLPPVKFPDELCGDRQEDIWEPLIWIAQLCGQEWQTRAWKACAGLLEAPRFTPETPNTNCSATAVIT